MSTSRAKSKNKAASSGTESTKDSTSSQNSDVDEQSTKILTVVEDKHAQLIDKIDEGNKSLTSSIETLDASLNSTLEDIASNLKQLVALQQAAQTSSPPSLSPSLSSSVQPIAPTSTAGIKFEQENIDDNNNNNDDRQQISPPLPTNADVRASKIQQRSIFVAPVGIFESTVDKGTFIMPPNTKAMMYEETHQELCGVTVLRMHSYTYADSTTTRSFDIHIHKPRGGAPNMTISGNNIFAATPEEKCDIPSLHFSELQKAVDLFNEKVQPAWEPVRLGTYRNCTWAFSGHDGVQQSKLLQVLNTITLESDKLYDIKKWYDGICNALNASVRTPVDMLPGFLNIIPSISFRRLFVPDKKSVYHNECSNHYLQVTRQLSAWLQRPKTINPANAPQTYAILQLNITEDDGFAALHNILRSRCPHLGGCTHNTLTEINNLSIQPQETLLEFSTRASALQGEVSLQPNFPCPNDLLRRFLRQLQLTKNPTISAIISPDITSFEMWMSSHPNTNTMYPFLQLHQVTTRLILANVAPDTVLLPSSTTSTSSLQPWKPTIATIDVNSIPSDDSSLSTTSSQRHRLEQRLEQFSDEHLQQLQQTHPKLLPIIAAIRQRRTPRTECQACGLPGHDAERCFFRGEAFFPLDRLQRARQYNLTHGDKPKTPPKKSSTKSPPAVRFKNESSNNESSISSTPSPTITNITASPLHVRHTLALGDGTIDDDDEQRFKNLNDLLDDTDAGDQVLQSVSHVLHESTNTCPSQASPPSPSINNVNGLPSSSSSTSSPPSSRCELCSEIGHSSFDCPTLDIVPTSESVLLSDDYDMMLSASSHEAFGLKF